MGDQHCSRAAGYCHNTPCIRQGHIQFRHGHHELGHPLDTGLCQCVSNGWPLALFAFWWQGSQKVHENSI
eukprot:8781487-Karenia_brevis.AAC.1